MREARFKRSENNGKKDRGNDDNDDDDDEREVVNQPLFLFSRDKSLSRFRPCFTFYKQDMSIYCFLDYCFRNKDRHPDCKFNNDERRLQFCFVSQDFMVLVIKAIGKKKNYGKGDKMNRFFSRYYRRAERNRKQEKNRK